MQDTRGKYRSIVEQPWKLILQKSTLCVSMGTTILFKKSSMLQVESATTPNAARRSALKWKTEVNSATIRRGFNKIKGEKRQRTKGRLKRKRVKIVGIVVHQKIAAWWKTLSPISGRHPSAGTGNWSPTDCTCSWSCNSSLSAGGHSSHPVLCRLAFAGLLALGYPVRCLYSRSL